MGLFGLASKIGIFESDLLKLTEGKSSFGIASKLGVFESDLQKFIEGKSSFAFANKMGMFESDLQILLNKIGPKGAIGLVIGLLKG